ncbi:MAG: undecaprenyldiphospho-muramoylpentapeptide beta-N-acetylglucosaminyltransferase [Christensenellales bacterium]|nr:undecaprenyldiphospho-muramoylpentapeptide beta-N-acetylglucosaminyltransferase [Christensenellales bacterium]
MKRIVLTGGGTAGHVTPNLALIPRLIQEGWDIHYIGAADSVEQSLVGEIPQVTYHTVAVGKFRRYFDLKNFTDPFRVMKGVFQASVIIRRLKPDIVFSKGGFVSVPVVYGAKLNGVPVVIHESDMTPGLANKLSLPFASAECCTFPEAVRFAKGKGVYTGTPIRSEIFEGDRERGRALFGLDDSKPVLMVVGGSSGARAINEAVTQALPGLTENFQVLHLCGKGNQNASDEGVNNYVQCEYLNKEMADAYACADVLVSRAGANALCEILALNKPALLIPYPKGASRGDQILNAESFRQRGFCRVLDQAELTPERLEKEVISLYHDRGTLINAMRADDANSSGVDLVLEQIHKYAK